MPGNSKRQGAVRKTAKAPAPKGSGGNRRQGLEGKGPTPRAENRPGHKVGKRVEAEKRAVEAMASFPSREATLEEDQLNIKGPKSVLDRFRALRKAERYPYATLLGMLMDAYDQKKKST